MTRNNKFIIGLLLVVVLTGVASKVLANRAISSYQAELDRQLFNQREVMSNLAVVTARNDADEITNSLVRDCATEDRERFDVLLGQLDNRLSNEDLTVLRNLFNRCGDYYALRKAVMVQRLEREVKFYEQLVSQLDALTGSSNSEEKDLEKWQMLADFERQQAEYFSSLVGQQEEIIMALLNGAEVDAPEIVEILGRVREAQENLMLANTQAASIRNELISL